MIPYGRQWLEEDDIQAVLQVLRSDWLTQGSKVAEFEEAVAAYCGARYAVAVANGTAALHLACLALDLPAAAPVITSPITFVASANCAFYCGARPSLVDIEPRAYNLDPARLGEHLRQSVAKSGGGGSRPAGVVIPVHFGGHPCDMVEIGRIAEGHGLAVIEDASHALGAGYRHGEGTTAAVEVRVGSCRHSLMTVFSFHPVKAITTGEGGMVLTNEPDLHERLKLLRHHGIAKAVDQASPWYYEMQLLGFNYRLSDIHCALGISQLKKLDRFIQRRREMAARYTAAFQETAYLIPPTELGYARSAYHLYVVQLRLERLRVGREEIFRALRQRGLGVNVHYLPLHLHPYYARRLGHRRGDFPIAEGYYERALTLPLYPRMSDEEVETVIGVVKAVLEEFSK